MLNPKIIIRTGKKYVIFLGRERENLIIEEGFKVGQLQVCSLISQ